jgi:hypothetical protein
VRLTIGCLLVQRTRTGWECWSCDVLDQALSLTVDGDASMLPVVDPAASDPRVGCVPVGDVRAVGSLPRSYWATTNLAERNGAHRLALSRMESE